MAVIPRSSRTQLSSGRVAGSGVSIPTSIADTGQQLEGQALAGLGQDITQTAMIFKELEDRKNKATDLSQSGRDQESLSLAEQSINLEEKDVPISDRTKNYYEEQYDDKFVFDPSLYGTEAGSQSAKQAYEFKRESYISGKLIDNTDLAVRESIKTREDIYMQEPTEANRDLYKESLRLMHTDDMTEVLLKQGDIDATAASVDRSLRKNDFALASAIVNEAEIPEENKSKIEKTIDASEKQYKAELESQEKELKRQTTDQSLLELNRGELSVSELDRRFEADLIERDEWKSMRESLTTTIPDASDVFVRADLNTTMSEFESGQIPKHIAQAKYIKALPKLDKADRDKFGNSLEAIPNKVIGNAMSNAKKAGRELVSPRFKTVQGEFVIPDFTGERAEENRAQEERKLNLEIRLMGQYQDALDEWKESQAGKDIRPRDVRAVENDLLIEYRKIKQLAIDDLEREIRGIEEPVTVPEQIQESKSLSEIRDELTKPISKMTIEEKKARLAELRRLKAK
jgi:hypothetical protein